MSSAYVQRDRRAEGDFIAGIAAAPRTRSFGGDGDLSEPFTGTCDSGIQREAVTRVRKAGVYFSQRWKYSEAKRMR